MNILVCGAHGFIGRHITAALRHAGHHVIAGVHHARHPDDISIDFSRDTSPELWQERLRTNHQHMPIDIIINAVGILHETRQQTFDALHRDAPIALFQAAQSIGVKGIIQCSALGAHFEHDVHADSTPYMRSKREADAFLSKSSIPYLILRPSLIVGIDGQSSRFFRALASLPLIPLPGRGGQQIQPVDINDVCECILAWINNVNRQSQITNAVGPIPITYRSMLEQYRELMGLPSAWFIPIPHVLMRLAARCAAVLPQKILTADSLRMLEQNNVASPSAFSDLLGHAPRTSQDWFADIPPPMLAMDAVNVWAIPTLRYCLSLVWIITGLLSLGIYPIKGSMQLLAPLGVTDDIAKTMVMTAAFIDIGFGIATLLRPSRWLWAIQASLIAGYSTVIALTLPMFLLHPFGPVLKNIPILGILLVLFCSTPAATHRRTS